ncbi:MAG: TonB-dependent receptor [Cyclobacteriaceae bacterium]
MSSFLPKLAFILISLVLFLSEGRAQKVEGVIKSTDGEVLPGATLMLTENGLGTATDAEGRFSLSSVPPGTYTLLISHIGYETQQQKLEINAEQRLSLEVSLREKSKALEDVVVTATRTARSVEEVPLPVQVVDKEQIERIGSLRLDEVLQEQTGLQMISDHGSGLQMQGLSSDYILVLIDGEPVIGRTAGTVDLTRLTVNNIERIEIIRGPSSSLYGSEAMAGVVNIITKGNDIGWQGSFGTQYRSFNTLDAQMEAGYRNDRLSVRMFANRLGSDGYDLTPESVSQTVAPYEAFTLGPKLSYKISNKLQLNITSRFYQESSEDQLDLRLDGVSTRMNSFNQRSDWNVLPILEFRPNDRHKLQIRQYFSGYETLSELNITEGNELYDRSTFDQTFQRSEAQYDWYQSDKHIVTAGLGYLGEQVEATRYDDVNQFTSSYAFAQYQWQPSQQWNVVAGGRFDVHSAYANRLSPKLAIGYHPNKWFNVRASFGGGYKAPDFRQLLLAFTNPVAGYSVFGSSVVQEKFAELEAQGQIDRVFIDPSTVEEIRAESSLAYNLGFDIKPKESLHWQVNLFYNDIQDLIETAPIARKTNGQNIFSYFNFSEVITQGVETQLDYDPFPAWAFSVGYQYLDSRDQQAYEQIQNGEVFGRDASNRTVTITTEDYGGLFNRSRHSGNAKVFYTNTRHQFDVNLRSIYRGRWGLGDFNGNSVLDADNEYADGYWLFNLAARKHFGEWLSLEAGVNNLFGQATINEPALAGRIFFAGLQFNFSNN